MTYKDIICADRPDPVTAPEGEQPYAHIRADKFVSDSPCLPDSMLRPFADCKDEALSPGDPP